VTGPLAAVPEVAQAVQAVLVQAVLVQVVGRVQPRGQVRAGKRQREDELLCRYEQMRGACGNARVELARATDVPLGTLDGMLARARKRRVAAGGAVE
jgi:hypothetical protein